MPVESRRCMAVTRICATRLVATPTRFSSPANLQALGKTENTQHCRALRLPDNSVGGLRTILPKLLEIHVIDSRMPPRQIQAMRRNRLPGRMKGPLVTLFPTSSLGAGSPGLRDLISLAIGHDDNTRGRQREPKTDALRPRRKQVIMLLNEMLMAPQQLEFKTTSTDKKQQRTTGQASAKPPQLQWPPLELKHQRHPQHRRTLEPDISKVDEGLSLNTRECESISTSDEPSKTGIMDHESTKRHAKSR